LKITGRTAGRLSILHPESCDFAGDLIVRGIVWMVRTLLDDAGNTPPLEIPTFCNVLEMFPQTFPTETNV